MKRSITVALLAAALMVLPGCYAMDIDASGLQPNVLMHTGDRAQPDRLGQFESRVTGSWLLWGLVEMSEPDIADAIDREVRRAGGSGVTAVGIRTQQTFIDGLLSLITLGLYGQRSTFITGTVVR